MRLGLLAGDDCRELRQILVKETRDAQTMDLLKAGEHHRGGALLAVQIAAGERLDSLLQHLLLPARGDLEEEQLFAVVKLVKRGFGDAGLGGQRVQRRLLRAVVDGVAACALKEAGADGFPLLRCKRLSHSIPFFSLKQPRAAAPGAPWFLGESVPFTGA